jgi:hypothetical protein
VDDGIICIMSTKHSANQVMAVVAQVIIFEMVSMISESVGMET